MPRIGILGSSSGYEGKKKAGAKADVASELDQVEAEAEADWKDALLETLLKMSPTAFERLAQGRRGRRLRKKAQRSVE